MKRNNLRRVSQHPISLQRLLRVCDILAAAPEPWEAHLSPENRNALERLGMDVADAAIHRALQEAK